MVYAVPSASRTARPNRLLQGEEDEDDDDGRNQEWRLPLCSPAGSGALTYTIVLAGRASLDGSLCARPTKPASLMLVTSITARTASST